MVELQEGVVIEPVWVDRSYAPPSAEDRKHSEAQEKEERRSKRSDGSITKSSPNFTGGWNNCGTSCVIACGASMKRISAPGDCKIIEKIRELEKQCLGGRE